MKKKLLVTLLILGAIAVTPFSVSAAEINSAETAIITPQYESIVQVRVFTQMKGSIVTSSCDFYLKDASYSCNITLKLESSTNKINWTEEKTWSDTFSIIRGSYSGSKAVYSGYYYRTVATVDVYDNNGKYIETAEVTSSAIRY